MHLDRGIVHTYRWSDGLSTRPDDQKTFTRQSTDTNGAPKDPLHSLFTSLLLFHPKCSWGSRDHHGGFLLMSISWGKIEVIALFYISFFPLLLYFCLLHIYPINIHMETRRLFIWLSNSPASKSSWKTHLDGLYPKHIINISSDTIIQIPTPSLPFL